MKIFKLIFILLITLNVSASDEIITVDFDKSMGSENKPQYNTLFSTRESAEIYEFYKKLWEKNSPDKMKKSPTPRIPKIIHHLWLGEKPVPKLFLQFAEGCKKLHPDWQYKLWREKDLEKFYKKNKSMLDFFDKNYTAQKDIYLHIILNEYGGVFMDMDYECKKNMDDLIYKYDFFAGIEMPRVKVKGIEPSISIVGSAPKYKLIQETLKYIPKKMKNCHKKDKFILYNFRFKMINLYRKITGKPRIEKCSSVHPHSVYPIFEKQRELCKNFDCKEVVFPATYFNPVSGDEYKNYKLIDKIKIFLGLESGKNYFTHPRQETIAVQDWANMENNE